MKQNSKKTNIIYCFGTGIGGLFLALHAVERAHFKLPKEKRGRCIIVTTGSMSLYGKFIEQHPHVELISAHKKHLFGFLIKLFGLLKNYNQVYHAPSFGRLSFGAVILNIFLRFLKPSSKIIGFRKNRTYFSDKLFSQLISRDTITSVFSLINEAVVQDESVKHNDPSIIFCRGGVSLPKPYIIVHPFPSNPKRSLPDERWTLLLCYLRDHFPSHQVVMTGGPEDKKRANSLMKDNPEVRFVRDITTDIQETMEIVAGAELFIGVDTGITHLANIFKNKTVVIGNNSNPCWLPTYNEFATILTSKKDCNCLGNKQGDCSVKYKGQDYFACLFNIKDKEIYKAVDLVLLEKNI